MEVLVYGTGTMGKGITQVLARNNHKVFLYNRNSDKTKKALLSIKNSLNKLIEKGKLTEDNVFSIMKNINLINILDEAKSVEIVIETVSEDIAVKKEIFREVDNIINKNAILATNTSSLSITELASVTTRPDKVIGMHFFNPAPIMELVEVVKGITTSTETVDYILGVSNDLGKKGVLVEEAPGFIVNRILIPMINEAIGVLYEGVASSEGIDQAMKLGANHPIGPLALADLIGLDVCLNIMDSLHKELGLDKYSAHPLLRKMVRANKMGRKTSEGFYSYN